MKNYIKSNLKYLRKFHKGGVTLQEISDYLGNKSRSTYVGWENGDRNPSINTIQKLAKYFQITLSNLIEVDLSDPESIKTDYVITFENYENRCKLYQRELSEKDVEIEKLKKTDKKLYDGKKKIEELESILFLQKKSLKRYEDDILPDKSRLIDLWINSCQKAEDRLKKIPVWVQKLFKANDPALVNEKMN